ncbi:MAG: response regulator transcription factor [Peptococcaceae bacterium]|nr:response regulator transcription factor [Peptococcaceae bacterium]
MRVAICDDEPVVLESLRLCIEKQPLVKSVQVFSTMEKFQKEIEKDCRFDVALMDIEWEKEKNGIDFAEQLLVLAPQLQVIFVTAYNERFSQQIFLKNTNLCGYLVKPVQESLLSVLLEKAQQKRFLATDEKLLIQQKGIVHAISFRDIFFIESVGHQLIIHTSESKIICYEKIDDMKQRLPEHFLQCHKSYIVNMQIIRRIEKNKIILQHDKEIPVSKARYAEVRNTFFRYMGQML